VSMFRRRLRRRLLMMSHANFIFHGFAVSLDQLPSSNKHAASSERTGLYLRPRNVLSKYAEALDDGRIPT
jgi:hypothetical protein